MKHRVPRAESVERESDESRSQRKQSGSDAAAQLHQSPRQLKQEQRVNAVFGEAVQREADDEELLQGKFDTAQRMNGVEDEDVMQGKLAPAQRQSMDLEDELPMQGKFSSSGSAQLQAEPPAENLTGMPDQLKAGIESLSGMDMSAVRVHRNSDKPAQLSALAYAQGNDIHLGPGQEQHLPHEAWHVVQQRQGRVQATMQMQGVAVNDDVGLEREADEMGGRAEGDVERLVGDGNRRSLTLGLLRAASSESLQGRINGTMQLVDEEKPKHRGNGLPINNSMILSGLTCLVVLGIYVYITKRGIPTEQEESVKFLVSAAQEGISSISKEDVEKVILNNGQNSSSDYLEIIKNRGLEIPMSLLKEVVNAWAGGGMGGAYAAAKAIFMGGSGEDAFNAGGGGPFENP
jgi:hypothetical protein